ncbi:MAG: hypothetical protein ACRDPH_02875 [Marmoricola sp.]
MDDPGGAEAAEEIGYSHRMVATDQTAAGLVPGAMRWMWATAAGLVWPLIPLGWALVLWLVVHTLAGTVAVLVVGEALIVWSQWRGLRRQLRIRFPPGQTVAAGFGETALVFSNQDFSVRVGYEALRSVREDRAGLYLREKARPALHTFPRELVGEDDLARLRRGVG